MELLMLLKVVSNKKVFERLQQIALVSDNWSSIRSFQRQQHCKHDGHIPFYINELQTSVDVTNGVTLMMFADRSADCEDGIDVFFTLYVVTLKVIC